ncbi:PREDICTED: transmembrane protein 60-like [Cyprinodon variegatus]|uniref:Transmembrane protein 60 n=1 Tax=Cyprinodon variegatus TaxID=28743 RepID=A0A3Q2CKW7_CYPVA|nr:PREDICTED: transmembrane protein 60-like [Cyprinodon variegatus]XP_015259153.1 PREDICTED: transmembrane protein 60-like [Cyprinodon variegatus]XP_015259160.1 PREDICTED: transmembrane protein 60-like [Cyprinodon variegatus]XP_015259168.1 PREDICTED: transmembrane protein 60-like [Cyprinodon variegatus]
MKMSLAQRVFLSWIFALIFLIMLVLKLDSKLNWSWYLIFLPVWTFDTILILIQIMEMAGRCKPDFDPRNEEKSVKRRLWYLAALLLKKAFCLTLCSRLEKMTETWVSVICVPLWLLLGGAVLDLGYSVFHNRRD